MILETKYYGSSLAIYVETMCKEKYGGIHSQDFKYYIMIRNTLGSITCPISTLYITYNKTIDYANIHISFAK